MALTRDDKAKLLAALEDRMGRARAALVADYAGLTVANVSEIRRSFRAAGVEYRVVKNKLMKRILKGSPREGLSGAFTKTTAVAFKYDQEYGALGKAAKELATKFDKLKFKGGFVEADVLHGPTALDTMASLPTLDEARAQLLGVINAPASKLLAMINTPGSQLAGVIQAKAEKDKEAATPAA